MTSHQLARKLLELPELIPVVETGTDPSDLVEVTSVEVVRNKYTLTCDKDGNPIPKGVTIIELS